MQTLYKFIKIFQKCLLNKFLLNVSQSKILATPIYMNYFASNVLPLTNYLNKIKIVLIINLKLKLIIIN